MRRYLTAVPLALLALLVLASPASAGRTWCRMDPVFDVNGRTVNVYVSSYAEMNAAATGPVQVVLAVPRGVSARLVSTDAGFGYGYDVRIEYSDKLQVSGNTINMQVSVYAPAGDGRLPVQVDVEGINGSVKTTRTKSGFANKWIVVAIPMK